MNTPLGKSKLRVGLSRMSGSINKSSSILSPSNVTNSASSSSTTPAVSSKVSSMRSVITQKKLKFAATKQLENDPLEDTEKLEELDLEALKEVVAEKRETLRLQEKHLEEKEELTNLTERWKEAGLLAIDELKKTTQKSLTTEQVLDSFKISHNIFLSDDEL